LSEREKWNTVLHVKLGKKHFLLVCMCAAAAEAVSFMCIKQVEEGGREGRTEGGREVTFYCKELTVTFSLHSIHRTIASCTKSIQTPTTGAGWVHQPALWMMVSELSFAFGEGFSGAELPWGFL
jgi:hypothetical protein